MKGTITLEVLVNIEPNKIDTVRLDNGEVWALDGECNMCGDCCKGWGSPQIIQRLAPERSAACPDCIELVRNVDFFGVETFRCQSYPYRPYPCAIWPADPHQPLPEKCSYRWRKVT